MEVVLESFSAIQKQNQNYQIMGISISTFFFFFFLVTPTGNHFPRVKPVRTLTLDIYPELLASSTPSLKPPKTN